MYKKIVTFLFIGILMLAPTPSFAKGFSGGHSSSHFGGSSITRSGHTSDSHQSNNSYSNGSTYHSGYRSPSPNVGSSSYRNYSHSTPSKSGSLLSHAAAFGGGALLGGMLGSMMHPFGGGYGYGGVSQGFPFMGLIIDVIIIGILFMLARRFFFR
jgi:predicted lipid-binding transport protein (Tim44 family)